MTMTPMKDQGKNSPFMASTVKKSPFKTEADLKFESRQDKVTPAYLPTSHPCLPGNGLAYF